MATRVWTFNFNGLSHIIELQHGTISGIRVVLLDGKIVDSGRQFIDFGSVHRFSIESHPCQVLIQTNGFTFRYDFSVDGNSLGEGTTAPNSTPISASQVVLPKSTSNSSRLPLGDILADLFLGIGALLRSVIYKADSKAKKFRARIHQASNTLVKSAIIFLTILLFAQIYVLLIELVYTPLHLGPSFYLYNYDNGDIYRISIWGDWIEKVLSSNSTGGSTLGTIRFNPKGSYFLVLRDDELWVLDTDTYKAKKVAKGVAENFMTPLWSPDSQKILYYDNLQNEYRVVDIKSENNSKVLGALGNLTQYQIYSWVGDNRLHISNMGHYLVDIDGNNLQKIGGFYTDIFWSPDSKKYVVSNWKDYYIYLGISNEPQTNKFWINNKPLKTQAYVFWGRNSDFFLVATGAIGIYNSDGKELNSVNSYKLCSNMRGALPGLDAIGKSFDESLFAIYLDCGSTSEQTKHGSEIYLLTLPTLKPYQTNIPREFIIQDSKWKIKSNQTDQFEGWGARILGWWPTSRWISSTMAVFVHQTDKAWLVLSSLVNLIMLILIIRQKKYAGKK